MKVYDGALLIEIYTVRLSRIPNCFFFKNKAIVDRGVLPKAERERLYLFSASWSREREQGISAIHPSD